MHRSKKESATSPLKYLLRIVEIFTRLVQLNQLCFTAEDLLVLTPPKKKAMIRRGKQFAAEHCCRTHHSQHGSPLQGCIPAPSLGQLQLLWLPGAAGSAREKHLGLPCHFYFPSILQSALQARSCRVKYQSMNNKK